MGGCVSKEKKQALNALYYSRNRKRVLLRTRERYRANRQKYIDYACVYQKKHSDKKKVWAHEGQKARRALYRAISDTAKEKPCADCDIQYPPYVLDFDHVRGTKLFTISKAVAAGISIDKIMDEIAKCDVVCANCHRERTHRQELVRFCRGEK